MARMQQGTPPASQELTVGEVAARSGVAVSTLHFYENKGLIHSRRSGGNQRRYAREVLRRIAVIRVAQRIGIPLDEIGRALAGLPEARTPTRTDWARLSAHWRKDLEARIAELQALNNELTTCIGCGCLSLDRCKLWNPQDRVAAEGAGPRLFGKAGKMAPPPD